MENIEKIYQIGPFVYNFGVAEIIAVIMLIIAAITIVHSIREWNTSNLNKRAEYIHKLIEKLRDDPKISDAFYMLEYENNWYSVDFHNSGEKEKNLDRMLSYLSYLCYLRKQKLIKEEEFKLFEYQIIRTINNSGVKEYMNFLYYFSRKNNSVFSFEYLWEYAKELEAKNK